MSGLDPNTPEITQRLVAILAADAVGYSRLMAADAHSTVAALEAARAVFRQEIESRRGRVVDVAGDSVLAVFETATAAVSGALAIQQQLEVLCAKAPEERRMRFRLGLHLGDVIQKADGSVYGDGVNVAARLQGLAAPGSIMASESVREAVRGKVNATFQDQGPQQVKNITEPVRAYRIARDGDVTSMAAGGIGQIRLSLPDKPSVAVLPFDNMSGSPEQAYFADGIAEDLITALSRVSWLFVIARNSSFAFRGEKIDVRTIGARLGVRYLVEGSVRRAGERVRVTAQLIEAASGQHLWADRYDGSLDLIFELQDQITASLVGAIEPKLRSTEIARARRKRPESHDAFDLLLQALPHVATMTGDGLSRAIDLLDRAIVLSPTYSQALGYSAYCRALRPFHGYSADAARDFREASELARRALDSDPEDPVGLRAAGVTVVLVNRDYQAGWDLMDRSLAIDSNSAYSWALRGWISIWAGDPEQAISEFERAIRLSPYDHWTGNYSLGMAFALNTSGRFEEGLRWARRAVQENPSWIACHRQLVGALSLVGRLEEAREAARRHQAIDPNFTVRRWVETGPFHRTPSQERFFAALREAGLPG
jgi:adenylate cyclase